MPAQKTAKLTRSAIKLRQLEAAVLARLRPQEVTIVVDEQTRMRRFGLDPDNPKHLREWAKARSQRTAEKQLQELKDAWQKQWERQHKRKARSSQAAQQD